MTLTLLLYLIGVAALVGHWRGWWVALHARARTLYARRALEAVHARREVAEAHRIHAEQDAREEVRRHRIALVEATARLDALTQARDRPISVVEGGRKP